MATSLNNLLACEKAQPSERPVSWDPKAELQDLYSSYLTRVCSRCYGYYLSSTTTLRS